MAKLLKDYLVAQELVDQTTGRNSWFTEKTFQKAKKALADVISPQELVVWEGVWQRESTIATIEEHPSTYSG